MKKIFFVVGLQIFIITIINISKKTFLNGIKRASSFVKYLS